MHRLIYALVLVGLICGSAKFSAMTRREIDAGIAPPHTEVTVDGLHVALPSTIWQFPPELLPGP